MVIEIPGLPDAEVSQGLQLPDPGRYSLKVLGVDADNSKPSKPKIVFTYLVVDGPQQRNIVRENNSLSPVGMQVKEFVPNQPQCAFRVKNVLVAAGIISRDDQTTAAFETEQLLGQAVTVDISHKEYEGKKQIELKYII